MWGASRRASGRRPHGGLTLTELVVYCFLLAAFSVTAFLSLPVHSGRQVADLEHAAGESSMLLTRIGQELANGSRGSLQVFSDPPGLIFLSAAPADGGPFRHAGDGQIMWQGWVGFFWQKERVLRAYQPLTTPRVVTSASMLPPRPTPAQILARESRPVAQEVRTFSVRRASSGAVEFQVRVEEGGSSMELQTTVAVRNP